jgi:hypothetical protein
MAKQHPPGTVRLRYLPLATPPVVGMLYRQPTSGRMHVVTAVQGAAVTLQTHGHHIHGAITRSTRVCTIHATMYPMGLLSTASQGNSGHPGNKCLRAVVPYTTA